MATISTMVRLISVRQKQPLGLGHAVLCGREAVGDEAFAVLLGDDLIDDDRDPGIAQLIRVHEQTGAGVVAIMEVPAGKEHMYGIVAGEVDATGHMRIRDMVEKPKSNPPSRWSIIGRYVLRPEVIGHLSKMERGAGNEVQLTDGMAKLIGQVPFHGLRYEGRRFDCGDKIGFLEAQIAFALKRPEMAGAVKGFLKTYCADL